MTRVQAGDRVANQNLLRVCVPIAAGVARRRGVGSAHVDDVIQDTLLTLHRVRATYDPRRPFLPWLSTITQRRAIDLMRRHKVRASRDWVSQVASVQMDDQLLACELLERSDRARLLGAAIEALPSSQREALRLLGLLEQTLAEASGITGRSTGALKVSFHRGLNTLRAILSAPG